MNKVFGKITKYSPITVYGNRTLINYDFKEVGDGVNATWNEIPFVQNGGKYPTLKNIKKLIIDDINSETDNKIISGFIWNDKKIWLSEENQRNFSEAQRIAMMTNSANLPITFKLGEDKDGNPVYHTFTSLDELTQFCLAAASYIQQCLAEGWQKKDNMDWSVYEAIIGPDNITPVE